MRTIVVLAALASASAFAPAGVLPSRLQRPGARCSNIAAQQQRHGSEGAEAYNLRLRQASGTARVLQALPSAAVLSQLIIPVQQAAAANAEYGLLEGKAVALVHPAMMFSLYLTTLYTGYQGLKWRELRTMGDDMRPLKAQVTAIQAQITAAGNASTSALAAQIAPLQAELDTKAATRKELAAGGYRDKHWAISSAILAGGVLFSVEGATDTYFRVGKLFPGPHLYAGAGITILWAVAAALVPKMQKGEDWARTAHIGINVAILGLFSWQLPTGFDILSKVWAKVPWTPIAKIASVGIESTMHKLS